MTFALASQQIGCLAGSPHQSRRMTTYRVLLPFRRSLKMYHAIQAGIIRVATLVPVRVKLLLRQDVPALLFEGIISIGFQNPNDKHFIMFVELMDQLVQDGDAVDLPRMKKTPLFIRAPVSERKASFPLIFWSTSLILRRTSLTREIQYKRISRVLTAFSFKLKRRQSLAELPKIRMMMLVQGSPGHAMRGMVVLLDGRLTKYAQQGCNLPVWTLEMR